MKKLFLAIMAIVFLATSAWADYLTCDPQPASVVTKYQIQLNGKVMLAEIEKVGIDQVRIYYNIDHLENGKYVVSAQAGNDKGEWSSPSDELKFYRGVHTPQNIGLYCVIEEPARLLRDNWLISHVSNEQDGQPGEKSIDGNINSQWHSGLVGTDNEVKHPHEIQIDMGKTFLISGFWCQTRQGTHPNCFIKDYKFYVSLEGNEWIEVVAGSLLEIREEQFVSFNPTNARFVSLVALSSTNESPCSTVAEINVLGY